MATQLEDKLKEMLLARGGSSDTVRELLELVEKETGPSADFERIREEANQAAVYFFDNGDKLRKVEEIGENQAFNERAKLYMTGLDMKLPGDQAERYGREMRSWVESLRETEQGELSYNIRSGDNIQVVALFQKAYQEFSRQACIIELLSSIRHQPPTVREKIYRGIAELLDLPDPLCVAEDLDQAIAGLKKLKKVRSCLGNSE